MASWQEDIENILTEIQAARLVLTQSAHADVVRAIVECETFLHDAGRDAKTRDEVCGYLVPLTRSQRVIAGELSRLE